MFSLSKMFIKILKEKKNKALYDLKSLKMLDL